MCNLDLFSLLWVTKEKGAVREVSFVHFVKKILERKRKEKVRKRKKKERKKKRKREKEAGSQEREKEELQPRKKREEASHPPP